MSKIKLAFIAVAIVAGVGGAFATKPSAFCEGQQQYYKYGNSFLPAGVYGVDYTCVSAPGTCTWVLESPYEPGSYIPCRNGAYTWNP